ncbi:YHS domain-containing (seleno)protein [Alsobacter sp. R-9]
MTLARRNLITGAAVSVLAAALPGRAGAAQTERILVDPVSGLAIYGFDPVAYFIEGRAMAGSPDHEAPWGNAVWRFGSEGNRAAFLADPDVYAPAFGGYDAEAVLNGLAVASDPNVFAIIQQRLLLFRVAEGRDRFLAGGASLVADAEKAWTTLRETLSP